MRQTRVLVVVDDAIHRKLISTTLTEEGYTVAAVCDVSAALGALMDSSEPVVVVLEHAPQQLNGIELLRLLKLKPHPPDHYQIVLLTTDPHAVEQVFLGAFDPLPVDVLFKVFALDSIREAVHRASLRLPKARRKRN